MGILRRVKVAGLRAQLAVWAPLYSLRPGVLKLLYYGIRNWGDAINPPLVRLISGRSVLGVDIDARREMSPAARERLGTVVSVIGSILAHADEQTIVWGSGLQNSCALQGHPLEVRAVRGPLTRAELLKQGIECPETYGDPALILPRLYQPASTLPRYELGIVAHRKDAADPIVARLAADPRVLFINMQDTGLEVVDRFSACRRIVSSSLHGLIVADAYGIPAGWIRVSDRIPGGFFKYHDYHQSIGAHVEAPLRLNAGTMVDDLVDLCVRRELHIDLDRLMDSCPFNR